MRVVFCGGGTGGHVYPALTVAAALKRAVDGPLDLLYIGVRGKIDAELVAREGIPFASVTAGPLRTPTVFGTVAGGAQAAGRHRAGLPSAAPFSPRRRLRHRRLRQRRRRPRRAPATPAAAAVRTRPGSRPRGAPAGEVRRPYRRDHSAGPGDDARRQDDDARLPGPSRLLQPRPGAPATASAWTQRCPSLLRLRRQQRLHHPQRRRGMTSRSEFLTHGQLLHLTGPRDEQRVPRSGPNSRPTCASAGTSAPTCTATTWPTPSPPPTSPIMRAGASILGELPAARLPAILVPGEYEGWAQTPNAAFMEKQGAAVLLPQSRISRAANAGRIAARRRHARLETMRDALATFSRPNAADDLAKLVIEMAGAKPKVAA